MLAPCTIVALFLDAAKLKWNKLAGWLGFAVLRLKLATKDAAITAIATTAAQATTAFFFLPKCLFPYCISFWASFSSTLETCCS
jgi:hypothetical protein